MNSKSKPLFQKIRKGHSETKDILHEYLISRIKFSFLGGINFHGFNSRGLENAHEINEN